MNIILINTPHSVQTRIYLLPLNIIRREQSTSTAHLSAYTINNTRITIQNPCTAANYTSCDLRQFYSILICLNTAYQ